MTMSDQSSQTLSVSIPSHQVRRVSRHEVILRLLAAAGAIINIDFKWKSLPRHF